MHRFLPPFLAQFVGVSGLLLLKACVSAESNDSDIASLDAETSVPKAIQSVGQWDELDKDTRLAVLEKEHGRYANLKLTPRFLAQDAKDPQQKTFVEKMATHMRTHGTMTVEDPTHARIGDTKVYARVLLLDGKTILGGSVQFVQKGCDMPDESVREFRTEAEAEDASCETAPDAVWTAYGAFNHDGVPIERGDFMEWGSL